MDFMTKSISRAEIRELAKAFRLLFCAEQGGSFPVLKALEYFPIIFEGSSYEVVDNDKMSVETPAECRVNPDGTFLIRIREQTYDGAYQEIGAYRNHIVHELCHCFLYYLGYTPIMQRSFENGVISCYCSSEWQAKALCGEVMMPYEESKNMNYKAVASFYKVSSSSAWYRCTQY